MLRGIGRQNCNYSKPVRIKGGIPSIVLCSPGHDSSYREYLEKFENIALREWTLKNADFEFLTDLVYTTINNGDRDGLPSTTST